jgi:hypothetical protein
MEDKECPHCKRYSISAWQALGSGRWWLAKCKLCGEKSYLKLPWQIGLLGDFLAQFFAVVLVVLLVVNLWLFLVAFVAMCTILVVGSIFGGQMVPVGASTKPQQ